MADYNEAELTTREKLAGKHQTEISKHNAEDVRTQLGHQLENYDFANRQNRDLADVQRDQNSRKTAADRFEAQRDLQNSSLGLMGSMGNAMNGSTTGNFMRMLENRNDKDNNTFWAQHQVNQDQVENTYNDSFNQNNVSKRDAITNAEKAINDIEAQLSANLNNINPKLYTEPGTGDANFNAGNVWEGAGDVKEHDSQISGYVMPDNRQGAQRNKLNGNSYFNRMMNTFNGR